MVYITSDLFGANRSLPTHSNANWNLTMADSHSEQQHHQQQQAAGLGKRKRWTDERDDASSRTSPASSRVMRQQQQQHHHQHQQQSQHSSFNSSPFDASSNINWSYTAPLAPSTTTTVRTPSHHHQYYRRPTKQHKRLNPKPPSLLKPHSTHTHLMDIESPSTTDTASPNNNNNDNDNTDLRPCHACNTAPKRKRDLENYMACKMCENCSCYICARRCLGCQRAVCKKCAVEVGEDGEPWCLRCFEKCIDT